MVATMINQMCMQTETCYNRQSEEISAAQIPKKYMALLDLYEFVNQRPSVNQIHVHVQYIYLTTHPIDKAAMKIMYISWVSF